MAVLAEPTTKRVEFVGLPSPFADPAVQAMKAQGALNPKRREALYDMERKRQRQGFCRFHGVTRRIVGTRDGLSRDYVFGPHTFVQDMDIADIDKLHNRMHTDANIQMAYRQAFRVVDDVITL
jgi:hypothetical protein